MLTTEQKVKITLDALSQVCDSKKTEGLKYKCNEICEYLCKYLETCDSHTELIGRVAIISTAEYINELEKQVKDLKKLVFDFGTGIAEKEHEALIKKLAECQ